MDLKDRVYASFRYNSSAIVRELDFDLNQINRSTCNFIYSTGYHLLQCSKMAET